jgi:hypothetical protein
VVGYAVPDGGSGQASSQAHTFTIEGGGRRPGRHRRWPPETGEET